MSIKDQISTNLKKAMKERDKFRVDTLRSLNSAIKYAEIETGEALDDEGILAVIAKEAKQRRDSIAEFQKAGRTDLVEQEAAELALLEQYLPEQLSADEIRAKAKTVIAELGATDVRGMGPVMQQMMSELRGRADGKMVNQIVRQLLSE